MSHLPYRLILAFTLFTGSVLASANLLAMSPLSTPVIAPPAITIPPATQTVTAGAKVTFSVMATGKTPLKYQWQFVSGPTSGNIAGATKSTYSITKVTPANAGAYRVIVSNAGGPTVSQSAMLTVRPNFAGKYNMVVVNYNPDDVMNQTPIGDNSSSGSALYGTATISGTGPFNLALNLKGYAGDETGQSSITANAGSVSAQGAVLIDDDQSNLSINMISAPDGTPIGFLGFGTALPDTGVHSSFILGLNATTAAPKSITSAAGNYTIIILGYNATAVTKSKPALNDAAVEIGTETVSANGNFTINLVQYASGGGDTLGVAEDPVVGTVSASGVVTIGGVKSTVVTKPVALNGQVIGFQGTFTNSDDGKPFSHIIIGLKNTSVVPPL